MQPKVYLKLPKWQVVNRIFKRYMRKVSGLSGALWEKSDFWNRDLTPSTRSCQVGRSVSPGESKFTRLVYW